MIAAGDAWHRRLVEKLKRSAIYRDYARVFSDTTGTPIALRAAVTRAQVHRPEPGQRALSCYRRQSGKHQHILFLQTLQAHHRIDLPLPVGSSVRRKSECAV